MVSVVSRERAAQAWCQESTKHLVMVPELAEAFAGILDAERFSCARLVCDHCRQGLRYNPDTNGHGKNLFQECRARAIWDAELLDKFAAYLERNPPPILEEMRRGLTAQQMAGASLTYQQVAAKAVDALERASMRSEIREAWLAFLASEARAEKPSAY
jgi:hypothetical protein